MDHVYSAGDPVLLKGTLIDIHDSGNYVVNIDGTDQHTTIPLATLLGGVDLLLAPPRIQIDPVVSPATPAIMQFGGASSQSAGAGQPKPYDRKSEQTTDEFASLPDSALSVSSFALRPPQPPEAS